MSKNQISIECYKSSFAELLRTCKGAHFSIAHEIYKKIISYPHEEQLNAFICICDMYGSIKAGENARKVTSPYYDELSNISKKKTESIRKRIDFYINKNYSRRIFYKKSHEYIFSGKSLKDESERVFALYLLLIDLRIPYYQYDGNMAYEMDEETFQKRLSETIEERSIIKNYLFRSLPQKTMHASLILNILGIAPPSQDDRQAVVQYEKTLIKLCYALLLKK